MPSKPTSRLAIAARFVDARSRATPIAAYPGALPPTLDAAYAIQDAAIELWPDEIGGWKIGLVSPQHRDAFGAVRLAGPIFKSQIQRTVESEAPVIPGGFAAAEAEFIIALGKDAPQEARSWSPEEAASYAGAMHIGVEIAGSPFAEINDHGPAVTASDFGNNAGLILGPAIENWRDLPLDQLRASVTIDGRGVGEGAASLIPGGPLAALAFIIEHCARRGIKLACGQLISTGATTGVHQIHIGQTIHAHFGSHGAIVCRAVAATPMRAHTQA